MNRQPFIPLCIVLLMSTLLVSPLVGMRGGTVKQIDYNHVKASSPLNNSHIVTRDVKIQQDTNDYDNVPEPNFRIMTVPDMHWAGGGTDDTLRGIWEDKTKDYAKLEADMYALMGDQVEGSGYYPYLLSTLPNYTQFTQFVYGNHEHWGGTFTDAEIFNLTSHDSTYRSFVIKNIHFMVFGWFSKTRAGQKWVEQELKEHSNQTTIMLQHNQPSATTTPSQGSWNRKTGGGRFRWEAMENYTTPSTPIVYFHGHSGISGSSVSDLYDYRPHYQEGSVHIFHCWVYKWRASGHGPYPVVDIYDDEIKIRYRAQYNGEHQWLDGDNDPGDMTVTVSSTWQDGTMMKGGTTIPSTGQEGDSFNNFYDYRYLGDPRLKFTGGKRKTIFGNNSMIERNSNPSTPPDHWGPGGTKGEDWWVTSDTYPDGSDQHMSLTINGSANVGGPYFHIPSTWTERDKTKVVMTFKYKANITDPDWGGRIHVDPGSVADSHGFNFHDTGGEWVINRHIFDPESVVDDPTGFSWQVRLYSGTGNWTIDSVRFEMEHPNPRSMEGAYVPSNTTWTSRNITVAVNGERFHRGGKLTGDYASFPLTDHTVYTVSVENIDGLNFTNWAVVDKGHTLRAKHFVPKFNREGHKIEVTVVNRSAPWQNCSTGKLYSYGRKYWIPYTRLDNLQVENMALAEPPGLQSYRFVFEEGDTISLYVHDFKNGAYLLPCSHSVPSSSQKHQRISFTETVPEGKQGNATLYLGQYTKENILGVLEDRQPVSYTIKNNKLFIPVNGSDVDIYLAQPVITSFTPSQASYKTGEPITLNLNLKSDYSAPAELDWKAQVKVTNQQESVTYKQVETTLSLKDTLTHSFVVGSLKEGRYQATVQITDPNTEYLMTSATIQFTVSDEVVGLPWFVYALIAVLGTAIVGTSLYVFKKQIKRSF